MREFPPLQIPYSSEAEFSKAVLAHIKVFPSQTNLNWISCGVIYISWPVMRAPMFEAIKRDTAYHIWICSYFCKFFRPQTFSYTCVAMKCHRPLSIASQNLHHNDRPITLMRCLDLKSCRNRRSLSKQACRTCTSTWTKKLSARWEDSCPWRGQRWSGILTLSEWSNKLESSLVLLFNLQIEGILSFEQ